MTNKIKERLLFAGVVVAALCWVLLFGMALFACDQDRHGRIFIPGPGPGPLPTPCNGLRRPKLPCKDAPPPCDEGESCHDHGGDD